MTSSTPEYLSTLLARISELESEVTALRAENKRLDDRETEGLLAFSKGAGRSDDTRIFSQGDEALKARIHAVTREKDAAMAKVKELERQREESTKKQPINTSLRLFDLVRYMRAELHEAGLITDSEYGWLCAGSDMATSPKGGSPSRERLEEYDEMRETIDTQHGLMVTAEKRGIAKGRLESAEELSTLRAQVEEMRRDGRAAIDAAKAHEITSGAT